MASKLKVKCGDIIFITSSFLSRNIFRIILAILVASVKRFRLTITLSLTFSLKVYFMYNLYKFAIRLCLLIYFELLLL